MSVSVEDLAEEVGTHAGDERLSTCLEVAAVILVELTEAAAGVTIPVVLTEQALLAAAAAEFYRRTSRGGVINDPFDDNNEIVVATDPHQAASDVLSSYVLPAIG